VVSTVLTYAGAIRCDRTETKRKKKLSKKRRRWKLQRKRRNDCVRRRNV